MQVAIQIPPAGIGNPTEFAVRAEEMGYDSLWAAELWGSSAVVQLADIAAATDDIGLGTAILNVFSRSPAVLAMESATLDRVSDGRFTLGVGTSTKKAVEDLHGESFENPVRHAHETIELAKKYLGDEGRVEYDGEVHHAADFPALGADVPVYHAALGPANRRVVARLCDGWIPHNIPFPELDESFEYIAEHAEEAGRDPEDITIAPYVPSAVSDDPEEARDAIRDHVAFYVGNGEGYRKAVAEHYPEADDVADAWRSGDRGEAADHVTDEMVEALGVAGTPEQARQQLTDIVESTVVELPMVVLPSQAPAQFAEATSEALAPEKF